MQGAVYALVYVVGWTPERVKVVVDEAIRDAQEDLAEDERQAAEQGGCDLGGV